jgi:tetratricopeptide (TPR) repeat protein
MLEFRCRSSLMPSALIILSIGLCGCGQNDKSITDTSAKTVATTPDKTIATTPSKRSDTDLPFDVLSTSTSPKPMTRPRSFDEAMRLAEQALNDERFLEAIQYSTAAIQFRPDRAAGYYDRARARFELETDQQVLAIPDLEMVTKIQLSNSNAFFMLATLDQSTGKLDKALGAISRAIKINPKDVEYLYLRAGLLDALNRRSDALADLNTSIKLDPFRGYTIRAKFFESKGEDEDALRDLAKAVQISLPHFNMGTSELLKLRASILSKHGRHQEAIKDLSTVVAKDLGGEDEDVLRLRGNEFAAMADYENAIRDYNRVISSSPDYARSSYEARGNAYKKLGKLKLADEDFKKAATLKERPAEKPVYDGH